MLDRPLHYCDTVVTNGDSDATSPNPKDETGSDTRLNTSLHISIA